MATRYQHRVECVNTLSKYSTPCKVAQVTTVSSSRASRGRRSARPSGDDRELAILTTAERLLEERSLADISVDDLAKGAGPFPARRSTSISSPRRRCCCRCSSRMIASADAEYDGAAQRLPAGPTAGMAHRHKSVLHRVRLAPRGGPSRHGSDIHQRGGPSGVVGLHAEVDRPHRGDDHRRARARRRAGDDPGSRPRESLRSRQTPMVSSPRQPKMLRRMRSQPSKRPATRCPRGPARRRAAGRRYRSRWRSRSACWPYC